MEGLRVLFFSRKRQKLGEEVESFAFEYLGGLSGLLCTTPTVNIVEYRVVSGSRLCKLGVFFHAPAEASSLFFTHTFSLRFEKFCDADNHIFVACGIKVKSWIRNNFSIYMYKSELSTLSTFSWLFQALKNASKLWLLLLYYQDTLLYFLRLYMYPS